MILQVNDIKLERGEIYIRSTRQTNSRTLALKACQILEIKTYLDEIRPQFGLPAVRQGKATSQLIVNRKGTSVQGVINHLFKALRSRYSWAKLRVRSGRA